MEPLALADRERLRPVMASDDVAGSIADHALLGPDLVGEPAAGVAVGDEADVMGVGLVRDAEAARRGLRAHLGLARGRAEREEAVRELLRREHAEHVGLVLGPVGRPVQLAVAEGIRLDIGVVPGDDGVEAEVERLLEEGGELDPLIAAHARVGGAASGVLGDEVVDDVELEAFGEVPHVVRDADDVRGALRIHRVLDRAAPSRTGAQGSGHPAEGEVHADDLVTGVDGARRGHRRVDAPAHRRQNLHGFHGTRGRMRVRQAAGR